MNYRTLNYINDSKNAIGKKDYFLDLARIIEMSS
jgi:hypothetical protein